MKALKFKSLILLVAFILLFALSSFLLVSCTDKGEDDLDELLTETDEEFDDDENESKDDETDDSESMDESTDILEETTEEEIIQYEKLIEKGVVYKTVSNSKLKLDIYYPTNRIYYNSPVIVAFHGGSWVSGERSDMIAAYAPFFNKLRANGYAVITVQYRFVSQSSYFPVNLEDCIDAIKFIAANNEEYNIDENAIGVMGYSAGAHLAMMCTYAAEYFGTLAIETVEIQETQPEADTDIAASTETELEKDDEIADSLPETTEPLPKDAEDTTDVAETLPIIKNININYCISLAGPTKMYDEDVNLYPKSILYMVDALFGGSYEEVPDIYKIGSPYYYVSEISETKKTPLMLVQSDNDNVVPYEQSKIMHEKATEVGIPCEFITLQGAGHRINFNYETMTTDAIDYMPEETDEIEEDVIALSRDDVINSLEKFVYANTNIAEKIEN